MNRYKILIADDHKMFAEGLAGLLEDEFDLVGIVGNGKALIEAATGQELDLIIVDISMPVLNGFDAVRRLKQNGEKAKVIFLTMHADTRLLAEAMRCGGSGYVLKHSAGEDLLSAIRQVMAGQTYITPAIEEEWHPLATTDVADRQHLNLTPRQREVLELLSAGFTMKEVAKKLGISTRTAESHKYEMMEGLGVGSTAELIQYAIKLGITGT
jgi:DNA-binding NarL/FixJ family response regulator